MKTGRPPEKPDPKICDALIDWIEKGQTLRDFCRQKNMPAYSTIYRWAEKDEEFAARLARARDIGQDLLAEETLEIIDTFPIEAVNNETKRLDAAHVTWLRNRCEQRMKLLAVWNPRKFGQRVDVTSGGKGLNITIDMSADDQQALNDRSTAAGEISGGTIK